MILSVQGKAKLFLFITLLSGISVVAGAKGKFRPATLCLPSENVYFSCSLEGTRKIASVCAKGNKSPDEGYVQYRYGSASKVEFKYPAILLPPRKTMSIIGVSRFAHSLGIHLKFKSGGYEYVVSTALFGGEVYVAKDGKLVFDKICQNRNSMPFLEDAMSGLPYGGPEEKVDSLDNH